MIIPVVADADTLFPATTRGLLIYLDYRGVIKLHWSPLILDEMSRALVDAGRKHSLADAKAHEKRMCDALPNATVAAAVVQSLFKDVAHAVNSPKDIHVAACARSLIAANAYPASEAVVLTTRNTKDFKKGALAGLGIELRKPDAFLQRHLCDASAGLCFRVQSLPERPRVEAAAGGLAREIAPGWSGGDSPGATRGTPGWRGETLKGTAACVRGVVRAQTCSTASRSRATHAAS
ncbi:PIN domain-containing protein [Variovorax sp. LjRoot130]|uniref:PIN domain-containing protein n=1 Tax=Variovorax sp. LjRoot130 TaxID=3342261 RepID=UPI003ED163A9